MRRTLQVTIILISLSLFPGGCRRGIESSRPAQKPVTAPSPELAEAIPITLPVLDALFADAAFKAELKSKLQLGDEQISTLQKISNEEVSKLRRGNAENLAGSAEAARENAITAVRNVIGAEKSEQLLALAREHWIKGSEELEVAPAKEPEPTMLPGPNAVPKDTRIVVNIPAFRMDVFENGSLIKSYKVGIGYPEFPLPTGLRKAQLIIFNPTWTPPDSPWVASMKDVAAGETVSAGSKLNPLGPIKIPIGMPSLIHGGKSLSKIGTFASHGCVGLTNAQVKDFAKVLIQASQTDMSAETIAVYLSRKTKTRVVNLNKLVPVELRYETIVLEDGKLHVYRDVYDQNTNNEDRLRAVVAANGINFDELSDQEKMQALESVNAMSRHPKKQPTPTPVKGAVENSAEAIANVSEKKAEAERKKKLRNQREIVLEISALSGKGYPAPVNLDTGAGVVANTTTAAIRQP